VEYNLTYVKPALCMYAVKSLYRMQL